MKITGRAEVAGLGSFALTHASLGSNSALTAQQFDLAHTWSEEPTRDPSTGKPIGFTLVDEMRRVTVTAVPTAASSASNNTKTIAAGAAVTPAPKALVTISGCNVAELNDTWLYASGQIQSTAAGKTRLVMTLERYAECDDTEHGYLATQVS